MAKKYKQDKSAIIIQARMSSNRFPGKMMARLCGMPLIEYVYKRCKQSSVSNVVVATSGDSSDDILYNHCRDNGIPVLRGSLDNVLERYIYTARHLGVDNIIRVCGDTLLVDISLINKLLSMLTEEKLDYVSLNKETCAPAFYSEAITLRALEKAALLTDNEEDLEHVTKFIVDKKDKFSTKFIDAHLSPLFLRYFRLTIDYPEDIQNVGMVINQLDNKFSFTSMEVLKVAEEKALKYKLNEFPTRVEIELSSACNLRCAYCPRRYLNQLNGFMEFSLFRRIIDEIAKYPKTILVLHRRGESLLHSDFIGMCNYAKGKFREIQLATNATLLDAEKSKAIIDAAHFISFSIDIPEVFDKTRIPAKYSEVESNIFRFMNLNKGKVRTQVSMVKTQDTHQRDIDKFKKIWQGKVDRIRIYEEHSQGGRFGSLTRDRGKRLPCAMPFYELLIYCDGKVGRCNHDWNGSPMGDANASSIKDIWNGSFLADLRQQHYKLNITDKVCNACDCWYPDIGNQGTGEIVE